MESDRSQPTEQVGRRRSLEGPDGLSPVAESGPPRDVGSPPESRLRKAHVQINRMQDFLCERGLYGEYLDWLMGYANGKVSN
jgi:hypothetical protein